MITICKGEHTLTVTHGAFRNYYMRLGYKPFNTTENVDESGQVNTHGEDGEDQNHTSSHFEEDENGDGLENDEVSLEEIPLGEMSHSQLIAYAEELGLDFPVEASKKELRSLIRQHIR